MLRRIQAALIAVIIAVSSVAFSTGTVFGADDASKFTVSVNSNFFENQTTTYKNIDKYADQNGDVFLTVEIAFNAPEKALLGVQIDSLSWDPNTLEFKEEYNKADNGNDLNVFPFAVEQNASGSAMINTYNDSNRGKIVANFSNITGNTHAYNEDGTPITMVKAVFKLLNKEAESAIINIHVDCIALSDLDKYQSSTNDISIVENGVVNTSYLPLYQTETTILPETGEDGYYIIGTMTGWEVDTDYKLEENPAAEGEYMFTGLDLTTSDQFKVVYSNDGTNKTIWYPDGIENNYGEHGEIQADGTYNIYFRPDGQGGDDWFYHCIYAEAEEPAPVYLIGDVNQDGYIDILDATMIQKYAIDKIDLNDTQKYVADVNDDGFIDVLDALDIQKFAVDKIKEFKKK